MKFSNSLYVRWKWNWSLVGSSLSRKYIRCFVCLFVLQTLVISLKTMHNACSPIQQFVSLFVCVKFRAHTSGRWGEPSAGCSKSVEWMVIVDKNKKTNKQKKNMSSVLFFRVSSGRVTLISKHDGVHLSLKNKQRHVYIKSSPIGVHLNSCLRAVSALQVDKQSLQITVTRITVENCVCVCV